VEAALTRSTLLGAFGLCRHTGRLVSPGAAGVSAAPARCPEASVAAPLTTPVGGRLGPSVSDFNTGRTA